MNSAVRIALGVAITVPWVSEVKAMIQRAHSSTASAAIHTVRIGEATVKIPPFKISLVGLCGNISTNSVLKKNSLYALFALADGA